MKKKKKRICVEAEATEIIGLDEQDQNPIKTQKNFFLPE